MINSDSFHWIEVLVANRDFLTLPTVSGSNVVESMLVYGKRTCRGWVNWKMYTGRNVEFSDHQYKWISFFEPPVDLLTRRIDNLLLPLRVAPLTRRSKAVKHKAGNKVWHSGRFIPKIITNKRGFFLKVEDLQLSKPQPGVLPAVVSCSS